MENPPKRPKVERSLVKAIAISAAAHLAGSAGGFGFGNHAGPEQVPAAHEPNVDPSHEAREKHEQFQRQRRAIVLEARQQVEQGNLRLGYFTIRANAIDIREYQNKESNLEELDQEYERVSHLFGDGMRAITNTARTARDFSQALITATENYHYQGVGGFMSDLLHDKTGSCEQISHFVVSLLQDNGFGHMAFIRQYPPDSSGYGHVAPMLETVDAHGNRADYDITAGEMAFEEGSRMSAAELVEAYARHFHLFDEGRDADIAHFPAANSAAQAAGPVGHNQNEEGHFDYPLPPQGHNISFPQGAIPFFSSRIINFYHVPPRSHAATREALMAERGLTPYQIDQAILGIQPPDIFFQSHIFVGGAHPGPDDVFLETREVIENRRLEDTSRNINIVELVAPLETNITRRSGLYGLLAAEYQNLNLDAQARFRFRAASHARQMSEHYSQEGQAALGQDYSTPSEIFEVFQQLSARGRGDNFSERGQFITSLKGLLFLGASGQGRLIAILNEFLNHEEHLSSQDQRSLDLLLSEACRFPATQERAIEILEHTSADRRTAVLHWIGFSSNIEGDNALAREAAAQKDMLEYYRDAINSGQSANPAHPGLIIEKRSFHQILEKVDQITTQRHLSVEMHDALVRSGLELFYLAWEEDEYREMNLQATRYPFTDREDLLNWLRSHPTPFGQRLIENYERHLVAE